MLSLAKRFFSFVIGELEDELTDSECEDVDTTELQKTHVGIITAYNKLCTADSGYGLIDNEIYFSEKAFVTHLDDQVELAVGLCVAAHCERPNSAHAWRVKSFAPHIGAVSDSKCSPYTLDEIKEQEERLWATPEEKSSIGVVTKFEDDNGVIDNYIPFVHPSASQYRPMPNDLVTYQLKREDEDVIHAVDVTPQRIKTYRDVLRDIRKDSRGRCYGFIGSDIFLSTDVYSLFLSQEGKPPKRGQRLHGSAVEGTGKAPWRTISCESAPTAVFKYTNNMWHCSKNLTCLFQSFLW